MVDPAALDAKVLAGLLLIQNMVGQLKGGRSMLGFVCRGLEALPGIREVRHSYERTVVSELERGGWRAVALSAADHGYGWFALECMDPPAFEPYAPYVDNVGFMVSLVLEEQRLRSLDENRRVALEAAVLERTEELTRLVAQLNSAREKGEEERLKAERYLEVSEAMIVELDTEGRVQIINKRGAELLGRSAESLIGQDWLTEAVPEDCRGEVRWILSRLLGGFEAFSEHFESEIRAADGTRRRIAWHSASSRDKSGKAVGTLSSGTDVTERFRLIEAAQQLEKMKSLGILAGGIAHDFNNFLTGAFGHLELAESSNEVGPTAKSHLTQALRAFERAKSLTQQLLTFARGGRPILRTEVLLPLVRSTADFVLSGTAIRSQYDFPEDLGVCSVDANQLSQVVENLCINALQAMPQGGTLTIAAQNIEVESRDARCIAPGRFVELSFRDTGPGIPQDIVGRVFDPFFTTKPQGTGLGLASAYAIVERHGGRLVALSTPGSGADLRIYLPRAVSGTSAHGVEPPQPVERAGTKAHGRILIMDDDAMLCELLRRQVARLGYGAVEAHDGAEALAILEKDGTVRAAVLDLTVPGGMGGLEAAARIRTRFPRIRLIASSGYSEDAVLAHPVRFGFDGALPKPFRIQALASVLDTVLVTGDGDVSSALERP